MHCTSSIDDRLSIESDATGINNFEQTLDVDYIEANRIVIRNLLQYNPTDGWSRLTL